MTNDQLVILAAKDSVVAVHRWAIPLWSDRAWEDHVNSALYRLSKLSVGEQSKIRMRYK